MAVRDSLNNNAYEMYSMDNVLDSVDLTVSAWNRTTVADGQWLQDHAIGPLSARDVYLADQIDDTNAAIADITATLADAGISTTSGDAIGYAIKPLNNQLYPSGRYEAHVMSLGGLPISLVSTSGDDSVISPYTVTYATFGNDAVERGGINVADNMLASVLTLHNGNGNAYQLAFSDKGMWYRALTGGDTKQAVTDAATVSYIPNAPAFAQIPTDAIIETKLDAALSDYCKKDETYTTADIDAALNNKLDSADFDIYTKNAPTTAYVNEASSAASAAAKDYGDATFAAITALNSYLTTAAAETAYASKMVNIEVLDDAPAISGGEQSVSAWLLEIVNKINELAAASTATS